MAVSSTDRENERKGLAGLKDRPCLALGLALGIVQTQREEIRQMEDVLDRLG